MKILHYVLGVSMLILGIDVILTTSTGSLYACPRCRRALPRGTLKRPHPGFPERNRHNKAAGSSAPSSTVNKEAVVKVPNSCAQSCCCVQQQKPSLPRVSHNNMKRE
jgi:hypothetical protein